MRRNIRTPGSQGRSVVRSESATLDGFQEVQDAQVVVTHDDQDLTLDGINMVDYYTSSTIKYPWAQDAYYMFPAVYLHYVAGRQSEWPDQAPVNAGPLHTRFAASRDGIAWEHVRTPAVRGAGHERRVRRKGARGSTGSCVPRRPPDLQYYVGGDDLHGWDATTRTTKCSPRRGSNPRARRAPISRLVLRMDGLCLPPLRLHRRRVPTEPVTFQGDAWC